MLFTHLPRRVLLRNLRYPRLGRHRWVVEMTLSWLNRYRRLKGSGIGVLRSVLGLPAPLLGAALQDLERISDESCSASTLRRRRDEWIDSGTMERDGWLRAAWTGTVLGGIATERLVFLRTRWGPTPLFTRFTPGHQKVKGHVALGRATAALTPHFNSEHNDRGYRTVPSSGRGDE